MESQEGDLLREEKRAHDLNFEVHHTAISGLGSFLLGAVENICGRGQMCQSPGQEKAQESVGWSHVLLKDIREGLRGFLKAIVELGSLTVTNANSFGAFKCIRSCCKRYTPHAAHRYAVK